jgi:hypothetical protein
MGGKLGFRKSSRFPFISDIAPPELPPSDKFPKPKIVITSLVVQIENKKA